MKSENSIQHFFFRELLCERQCTPRAGLRSASQHQATVNLKSVCKHLVLYLHLFCASVSEMWPKLPEKPERLFLGMLENVSI